MFRCRLAPTALPGFAPNSSFRAAATSLPKARAKHQSSAIISGPFVSKTDLPLLSRFSRTIFRAHRDTRGAST
jgi:hypothetical protein